jgi:hypothetical protein
VMIKSPMICRVGALEIFFGHYTVCMIRRQLKRSLKLCGHD